jgi:hypothetical protein
LKVVIISFPLTDLYEDFWACIAEVIVEMAVGNNVLVSLHIMKAQLHTFLTSVLVGGEGSALRSDSLTPGESTE